MRKLIFWGTILLLVAMATAACASADYLTIAQLREEAHSHWGQTFETQWRTVRLDAEIRLPNVEAVPLLAVKAGIPEPPVAADTSRWASARVINSMRLCLNAGDVEYPKTVEGRRVGGPTSKGNWYGGFAPENRYVPMDDITFGEITAMARTEIERAGFDPNEFQPELPERLWAHHVYAAGTKEDILPGYIFMDFHQKLMGIPILSHILETVTSRSGERYSNEIYPTFDSGLCYDGYTAGLTSLCIGYLKPVETLAVDVPLRPFSDVIAALEPEITGGRLRKIYEIELGYVLYNEPNAYHARHETEKETEALYRDVTYYAKPMWKINCLYVSNPRAKLAETASYTDDERNSLDYLQLLVDAQTSELIGESSAKDRAEFKGFLSWEDVKQN